MRTSPRRGYLVGGRPSGPWAGFATGGVVLIALLTGIALIVPNRVERRIEAAVEAELGDRFAGEPLIVDIDFRDVEMASRSPVVAMAAASAASRAAGVGAVRASLIRPDPSSLNFEAIGIQVGPQVVVSGTAFKPDEVAREIERLSGRPVLNSAQPPTSAIDPGGLRIDLAASVIAVLGPNATGGITLAEDRLLVTLHDLSEAESTAVAALLEGQSGVFASLN